MIKINKLNSSIKEKKILKDINLNINEGEILAILGHNGAGKTTLIKCILQLIKYSGEIKYSFDERDVYKYINVQMQTTAFEKNVKVIEICNLHKSLTNSDVNVEKLLEDFDLINHANSYAYNLSGGEKQKLSILLTLINNPKIIIFDEITTGLDVFSRKKIWRIIKNIKKEYNLTVVLTSHFLDEIEELSDSLAIMEKGSVIYEGSVSSFKNSVYPQQRYIIFNIENIKNDENIGDLLGRRKDLEYDNDYMSMPIFSNNESDIISKLQNIGASDIQVKSYTFEDAFIKKFGYLIDVEGSIES